MTPAEIIEALRRTQTKLVGSPYYGKLEDIHSVADAITLIEQLTAENARLIAELKRRPCPEYDEGEEPKSYKGEFIILRQAIRDVGVRLRKGEYCRMTDHMQDLCDCKAITSEYDRLITPAEPPAAAEGGGN